MHVSSLTNNTVGILYLKLWSAKEKFEDTTGFSWLQRHLNICFSNVGTLSYISIQNVPVNTSDITTKYHI